MDKNLSANAKARWKGYSDEQYWEIVDKIKAGVKRHWEGLSPEERERRTAHLAEARAKRSIKKLVSKGEAVK